MIGFPSTRLPHQTARSFDAAGAWDLNRTDKARRSSVVALECTCVALTDPGRVREHNEDAVYAGTVEGVNGDAPWTLLLVADGVGGHQRGEWASAEAVGLATREAGGLLAHMEPDEALRLLLEETNRNLWDRASADPSLNGAATTMVAVGTMRRGK